MKYPVFQLSIAHSDSMDQELEKMGPQACFSFFNPVDEKVYDKTVKKWTTTLLELSMKGRDIEAAPSTLLQTEDQSGTLGHVFRIGAMVLLLVGVWFLWQRFSHLFTKNKEVEASPLAQPME